MSFPMLLTECALKGVSHESQIRSLFLPVFSPLALPVMHSLCFGTHGGDRSVYQ